MDYKKLGVRCGLEVHQQLDTGKLFCRCPSKMREDKPDIIFTRRLRPVPSELGFYDPAAIEAYKKGLTYIYEAYSDSNCLVETDEEPVKPINEEALKTVLEVAIMLDAEVFDELFIMRKAVIDGSDISGFQRTLLIASKGKIKINGKELGISAIILEEDAGRMIRKTDKEIVYRLDRLGIPLIELATAPDIHSPTEAKATALGIGQLLRRTGKAKRGLGTIRQDLNVSIAEGTRIEIKGIQELETIDSYVENEILRQLRLLEIRNELRKRGLKENELKNEFIELKDIFNKTDCKIIADSLHKGMVVLGVRLEKFKGLLGKEIQPDRRFGTELADYVQTKAGVKGLFHSDELPKYGITENDVKKVSEKLGLGKDDAFVLVCESSEKAIQALQIIVERCKGALLGVPEETRDSLPEGNTKYSRPLPGPSRMYPETDVETIKIDTKHLDAIRKNLPLTIEERKKLYKKYGLNEKLTEKMKLSNHARFFKELLEKGYNPTTSAILLLEGLVSIRREGVDVGNSSYKMIEQVLRAEKEGKITQDVLLRILGEWSKEPTESIDFVINRLSLSSVGEPHIREVIKWIVKRNISLVKSKRETAAKALMGEAMKELRGKASGKLIMKILNEEIEKVLK